MKTQTRRALKQDKFVDSAGSGLDWLKRNRTRTIWTSVGIVVVVIAIIVVSVIEHASSKAAEAAFGQAMNVYNAQVAQPGQPGGAGVFSTAKDRAQAANRKFTDVAERFGGTKAGKNARYFAGITAIETGNDSTARADLLKTAHSGDKDLEALANLALAGLDRQSGKTSEAIALYKQLIAHPTVTVPASLAKLQLASLYEQTNPSEAAQIYAGLKSDKGAAGEIAAQKLGSK